MSYLLRASGHTIIAARDGEKGLALACSERPDLILCDIQLPGIGGMEIARRFRGDPANGAVPVLAVTALAMVGDRETIMAAGFDGYFTKPITPDTFIQQVEAFLRPALRGRSAVATFATTAPSAPVQGGRTILVIDDKEDNRELASSLLGGSGYKVTTAGAMLQALQLAREAAPDLILCDVCMAGGSGFDFLREIKADARLKSVPFVFLTSTMTSESERRKGLALGATQYLFRPIEPEDLLREIAAALRAP
jgi:two-component system cell cycle response regulator